MARKPNPLLAKIEARHRLDMAYQRTFTIQQCADMLLIAANAEFGFGADRLNRLEEVYYKVFTEYADLALEDGATDPEIVYTRAKVDAKLKEIMGPHFRPWEERYGSG